MANLLEYPSIQSQIKQTSIEEYHQLTELGLLPQNVELIRGVIIKKMPKSPEHAYIIDFLLSVFRNIFKSNYLIRSEQPITTSDSEPEPDISVIRGTLSDFKFSHPKTARLVVEVSFTTYELDFQKQYIYAEVLVDEYWLVNLKTNEIELYKNPVNGKYLERRIYQMEDAISVEGASLSLKELFG